MAVVISILNQKGGAGKTTLATNIASEIQNRGGKILLVDSDPQGSARDWKAASEINHVPVIGLDRPTLSRDLAAVVDGFEIVIIDGAPQLRDLVAAAIRASDAVLIPVQPSPYDIWAAKDLVDLIKVRREIANEKPQAAFVVSRAIQNTRLSKEIFEALSVYSIDIFHAHTTQRVAYAASAAEGISVVSSNDEKAKQEIQSIVEELMQWVS